MEEVGADIKKSRISPTPGFLKNSILNTKEPLVIKNVLSWDVLKWSLEDWITNLGDIKVDVRIGAKQCTKTPQWESTCEMVPVSLRDLFDKDQSLTGGTWFYFDYKHMKQYFKEKSEFLKSLSWSDFGFPEKNGKDSTIWIGSEGAYTPCHMDSYGCNIVAQVYGRKLWIMYPPTKTPLLKPSRVPYEESSTYSDIHFSCGLNPVEEVGDARVVELVAGDVLIVPRHWWHYVENLTTAISINMWLPLESDHASRLEESLVRYFVATVLKSHNSEGDVPLLNPNELDLLDEPVDLRQVSWCLDQVLKRVESIQATTSSTSNSCANQLTGCVTAVPTTSADELKQLLLKKCGCARECDDTNLPVPKTNLSAQHIINAFCHPDVIVKVAELLIAQRKS